ncbi:MAG: SPOR domain-containing protein [Candidatus Thiothrix singaporensis]|uniref:SPOR domain-containing protein n=1 Tax=Candidatus Thiothrix singaporensis TaxID=2799669 RepID=A0A7L6AQF2_9GAMM|nr:MAG: SPOR domain-containing protein [Candidatus Thiothrix singaporensis]
MSTETTITLGLKHMENRMKMGAAVLTLAALVSGCAPVPGTTPQAGATGDYNSYGTTASNNYGYGSTGTNTNASYYDYGSGGNTAGEGHPLMTILPGIATVMALAVPLPPVPLIMITPHLQVVAPPPIRQAASYAVQVVASPNRGTADAMASQMQSMGFNAVVDQVGGYYKVRVPFSSESEAKASLSRIRSSIPDAFYTVR